MNEQEIKIILYNYAINTTDILDQECMAIYDDVFDNLAKTIMDKIREENTDLKKEIKELTSIQKVIIHWVNQQDFPNRYELSKLIKE